MFGKFTSEFDIIVDTFFNIYISLNLDSKHIVLFTYYLLYTAVKSNRERTFLNVTLELGLFDCLYFICTKYISLNKNSKYIDLFTYPLLNTAVKSKRKRERERTLYFTLKFGLFVDTFYPLNIFPNILISY